MADSPKGKIAKRLRDHAQRGGFPFQDAAPGADDPLVGHQVNDDWGNLIHIRIVMNGDLP